MIEMILEVENNVESSKFYLWGHLSNQGESVLHINYDHCQVHADNVSKT